MQLGHQVPPILMIRGFPANWASAELISLPAVLGKLKAILSFPSFKWVNVYASGKAAFGLSTALKGVPPRALMFSPLRVPSGFTVALYSVGPDPIKADNCNWLSSRIPSR